MKKIAVIGVTESVGREILAFLADGGYRPSDTAALETKVPLGTQVSFGEEEDIDVGNLEDFDFAEAEIAIFCRIGGNFPPLCRQGGGQRL